MRPAARRSAKSIALLVAIVLAGCGQAPPARAPAPAAPPAPEERLGSDAVRLAARLTEVEAALDGDIDAWRAHGDPAAGPPPAAVTLGALYEQRVVRRLAVDRRLAAGVLPRLPGGLQRFIRAGVLALRDLRRLSGPPRRHRFKVGPAQPADRLLRAYGEAQRRFRVGWHVLAAVNLVESQFGRLRNDSVAGAKGPMQFLAATWRAFGLGGDVHDPRDAILGAANYLRHNGAPRRYRHALLAYNHSPLYVDAVLRFARRMAAGRRAYYALYAWQVYVRTPAGTRRLTGPGTPVT